MARQRELPRGERVLPGLWRLRLPLPLPGVPHCNAWAVSRGDGVVLFDTGMHLPGSLAQLELAMGAVGLSLERVELVAITHAHVDHWGQAASVRDRAGCEVWIHPNTAHATEPLRDPEAALARRLEIGRQSGVGPAALAQYAKLAKAVESGVAAAVEPDRALTDGVEIATDLGVWRTYETPGHAPSHVCFFEPERRLLISGDHLLGRISLYFDYGWSPDPVGEYLRSLEVVEALDARLCMAGHARTFTDVRGHVWATRELVRERLEATAAALTDGPRTALEVALATAEGELSPELTAWRLTETLCYLRHLEVAGTAVPDHRDGVDCWRLA